MKRKKKSDFWRRKSFLSIFLTLVIIGLIFASSFLIDEEIVEESSPNLTLPIVGPLGSAHHHSTFLIFINGEFRRFDDERFFETSPLVHIHDYSFAEIHTHATNITFGFLFKTINIDFNNSCLVFDNSEYYCNNETHSLKFYVEGKPNDDFGNHLTADWDHYLITYGDESEEEIQSQIERIPDPLASPPPDGRGPRSVFAPTYSL